MQGYREIRQVTQLQRQPTLPAWIDEPGSGVDHKAQATQRTLAVQPPDDVWREVYLFQSHPQGELPGVEHEGDGFINLYFFREMVHGLTRVYHRLLRAFEY